MIETITPVIGWVLGLAAARYVVAWDHWIAFTLLAGLCAMMIRNGLRKTGDAEHAENAPRRHSFWLLALTAVATSIDAMAVGVGLAFIDVDILPTAAAIGLATMLMVTVGVMLGRFWVPWPDDAQRSWAASY